MILLRASQGRQGAPMTSGGGNVAAPPKDAFYPQARPSNGHVLRVVIPGVPVPQARARAGRGGRHYTPERSRAYCQHVCLWLRMAMIGGKDAPKWFFGGLGPFRVALDVYRAANRGDADNFAKAILDACTKCRVWADDRYVLEVTTRLHVDKANPRVEAVVEVMDGRG